MSETIEHHEQDAAGHGRGHWLAQKATAIVNLILGLWALSAFVTHDLFAFGALQQWLSVEANAIMLVAMVISMCIHLLMGSQVIIEDYIHHRCFKAFKLWSQRIVFALLTLAAIISIL